MEWMHWFTDSSPVSIGSGELINYQILALLIKIWPLFLFTSVEKDLKYQQVNTILKFLFTIKHKRWPEKSYFY